MHFDHLSTLAFFQNMGAPQILLILFIILLLFGAKRLPELARGMGKALREFKSATKDIEDDIRSAFDGDEQKPAKPQKPSKAPPPPAPEKTEEAPEKGTEKARQSHDVSSSA